MAYNGFWADFSFNTGVVAAWCVFLWRVLDGPRFSWWGTVLLTLVIDAAYLLPVLLLTTAGSALRLLLYPTGALALAFLLFYGRPGRKLLAVAAELTASVLVEMLFSAVAIRAADLQMDAHYAVWADPHAVLYGGVFLLFLALVLLVVKFSQKYFKAQQATLGVVNGQVEEIYSGHNVIKAFNRENAVLADFNAANDKLYESAWKSQFLSGLMQPIMNFVGNLGYVAVAVAGSIFAAAGAITIGDIQAFIQYVKNFTQPIQQLAQVSNMLQSMAAASERVFEFLGEEEEDQLADPACRADPAAIDGQVTFDHVRFGYTPEKTVIHDFSCKVRPGQKVAIVGPTGAGKTTMVKLLMRFYDVDAGAITLNGRNVRDFDRSALREGFGMVLQDTWLFKGTIMENIRYGRLDATDEEVIAAAKAANADHFIRTLPGGYQMELNEDASNVSQGQKQLLTIARAILADNRILILDEATSSVDTRTEQRIQTAMDRLMEGRTSFVIAHRLSTIRDADKILVMRDGDIVEQGTHDELIDQGGFYADLYNSQFEDVTA